jgi:hypothetical protein
MKRPERVLNPRVGHVPAGNRGEDEVSSWVNVMWMPHTSLAQSSHLCLILRSSHITLDSMDVAEEWDDSSPSPETQRLSVKVTIYGDAGRQLIPVECRTPSESLTRRYKLGGVDGLHQVLGEGKHNAAEDEALEAREDPPPSVTRATHDCTFNTFVQLPIRWRDLPRDAYFYFEVLGVQDRVVSGPSPTVI